DAELRAREERLHAIATHLVQAGGKRIRPLVVLLVYHSSADGRPLVRRDDAIEAAVALELIHSATLLHDDIIDRGETRRGRPSAVSTLGSPTRWSRATSSSAAPSRSARASRPRSSAGRPRRASASPRARSCRGASGTIRP